MKTLLILASLAIASHAHALVGPAETCMDTFSSIKDFKVEIQKQEAYQIRRAQPFAPSKGLENYAKLIAKDPEFAKLFAEWDVTRIFATEEMPYFERNLEELFQTLANEKDLPSRELERVLRAQLHNRVPASQVEQRIASFVRGEAPIESILGDMTQDEVLLLYHGGNPLAPTPESLIGQYIAETGATTVARTFNTDASVAQGAGLQGPKRLAVSVDANTFAVWQKLFNRVDLLSVFAHAQVVQNGKIVSYNQNYGDLRAMSAGHILPAIVLKTTEAQRTETFLNIIANRKYVAWTQSVEMLPWLVKGYVSLKGAYETCTQWIGIMPIGDERVPQYGFPGAVDNYATNREGGAGPRYATLSSHGGIPDSPRLDKFFLAPGYKQFADVLGQQATNVRGEWANPGWLINTLIGPTSSNYVPFVFVFTDNAKAPLDPLFVPKFERPL